MENTFAFKPTSSNHLTPGEIIRVTAAHAREHGNKTLFTIGHSIDLLRWKDELEYFIATTKNGKIALVGRIEGLDDYQKHPENEPDLDEFPQPSQWNPKDKRTWFALSDVREIRISEGEIRNDEGRDMFDLIWRSSRAYVNYSQE